MLQQHLLQKQRHHTPQLPNYLKEVNTKAGAQIKPKMRILQKTPLKMQPPAVIILQKKYSIQEYKPTWKRYI